MSGGYPPTTPGRLHAKRIIAWWTPFIPQDETGILTHRSDGGMGGVGERPDSVIPAKAGIQGDAP